MYLSIAVRLGGVVLSVYFAHAAGAQETVEDPIAPIIKPKLKATVDVVLETYRNKREYRDRDFPLATGEFTRFREQVTTEFISMKFIASEQALPPVIQRTKP